MSPALAGGFLTTAPPGKSLHCLNFCSSVVNFESELCFFPQYFSISLSVSAKKATWDFDRDYIESVDQLGEYYPFNSIKSSDL